MKSLQLLAGATLASTILLIGCASTGPPLPPSLELPKPVTDLRALRKGDKVYLAWTVPSETTDRETVRHPGPSRICRSLQASMAACDTPAGEAPAQSPPGPQTAPSKPATSGQKATATYTDMLSPQLLRQNPAGFLTYAVEVLNLNHRSAGLSNRVQVPAVPTLPPPDDFKAQVTAEGVRLTWTGALHEHEDPVMRHVYRVYRQQAGNPTDTVVGEVLLGASPEGQLLDTSIEWEKTYDYRATVVTILPQQNKPDIQVEGEDTPPVEVVAHDVFPPGVPSGLQAVFSGVGQQPFIDLIWSPVADPDLAGYNVYRHEQGGPAAKLNSELVKAPAYRDANVQSGRKYAYSVTSVDVRGNESALSEETSEPVP